MRVRQREQIVPVHVAVHVKVHVNVNVNVRASVDVGVERSLGPGCPSNALSRVVRSPAETLRPQIPCGRLVHLLAGRGAIIRRSSKSAERPARVRVNLVRLGLRVPEWRDGHVDIDVDVDVVVVFDGDVNVDLDVPRVDAPLCSRRRAGRSSTSS
jgi:hypothetical protein